ncbi:MAG: hypothetical protein U0795_22885 [Pirellulales bacterium]
METLTFKINFFQSYQGGATQELWQDLIYLKAGTYAGSSLHYYHSGWGSLQDYENQQAQWMTVALAIQGTRSLTFGMTPDHHVEKFLSQHTTLSEKITRVEVTAFDSRRTHIHNEWGRLTPDFSLQIFDVTVASAIRTGADATWVVLYYSGATRTYF